MNDQELYARFLSALGFRTDMTEAPSGGVDVAELDGDTVEPPVRLHVDARALADHIGELANARPSPSPVDDADEEADEVEAALLRILLAQIEEAILTREPGQDHFVLAHGGVTVAATP